MKFKMKIEGDRQSGRKVVPHDPKSDLPLVFVKEISNFYIKFYIALFCDLSWIRLFFFSLSSLKTNQNEHMDSIRFNFQLNLAF